MNNEEVIAIKQLLNLAKYLEIGSVGRKRKK